jgi:sugar phosphate isomerase/epimerase
MKLALSSRLWESPEGYAVDQMQHLDIAHELGYEGVEMRYPLLPRRETETRQIADALRDRELTAVFGPCAGVPDDQASWDDASRVLDTLREVGAQWMKCIPMNEEQVPGMAKLADMAEERGMILCTQLHAATLTDTVASTEQFLREVDHPQLGVIIDAAHLQLAEDTNIDGAVQRLTPWLQLVNIQCLARDAQSGEWDQALPGDPDATDLGATIRALPSTDLWLTVMPACTTGKDPLVVARRYHEALLGLLNETSNIER